DTHFLELTGKRLDAVQRDEEPKDLVGAFEYSVDSAVAKEPLVGVRLDESAAAGELHHLVRGTPDHLAREHLADRSFQRPVRFVFGSEIRDDTEHRIGGVDVRRNRRELPLRDLEVGERLVELYALLDVASHLVKDMLGRAGASSSECEPAAVQYVHCD